MTYDLNKIDLNTLSERDFLTALWKNNSTKVLFEIDNTPKTAMTFDEFLSHCTCCGGNWGGMLLTGIEKLYPKVYDAIPDEMGAYAFQCIIKVLVLLNIIFKE